MEALTGYAEFSTKQVFKVILFSFSMQSIGDMTVVMSLGLDYKIAVSVVIIAFYLETCYTCFYIYVQIYKVWHFHYLMEPSAAFEEKVKKTIYIDNLSPQVTKAVLENALNQFGNVTEVQFIPTYFASCSVYAALVEMESIKQAEEIIREMGDSPLMISGMPRPVRAQKAQIEMFDDRPKKRRKIVCYWMDPDHQNFDVAKKIKDLTKKHAAEAAYMMELQLAEDEKLHNQQSETLKANYKKYELIDGAQTDGTLKRLAARYGTKLNEF
ncbi:hypothetical protein L1987_24511 [Smallanthus sonchifolius]|uniref:Uncharacterized protein n=1 Tax=Smallanthus sonchifolius TaxID=185202 RepID=A0ACB9ILJ6_9ASTR|nr:hypothetical protein L1987_24511 [Smallanthus sonchifolius]